MFERVFNVHGYTIKLKFNSKYAILCGNTAVGKTYIATLLGLIAQFSELDSDPNIFVVNPSVKEKPVQFDNVGSIVVIDEELSESDRQFFIKCSKRGLAYVLFISRSGNLGFSYGIDDFFELHYNDNCFEMCEIKYRNILNGRSPKGNIILCEDSGLGFSLAKRVFEPLGYTVDTSRGRSRIVNLAYTKYRDRSLIILTDLCGLNGGTIKFVSLLSKRSDVFVCDSESLEYELLNGLFPSAINDAAILLDDILYYDSREKYYEEILKTLVKNHFGVEYSKSKVSDDLIDAILSHDPVGDMSWFYEQIPRRANGFDNITTMRLI